MVERSCKMGKILTCNKPPDAECPADGFPFGCDPWCEYLKEMVQDAPTIEAIIPVLCQD